MFILLNECSSFKHLGLQPEIDLPQTKNDDQQKQQILCLARQRKRHVAEIYRRKNTQQSQSQRPSKHAPAGAERNRNRTLPKQLSFGETCVVLRNSCRLAAHNVKQKQNWRQQSKIVRCDHRTR